MATKGGSGMRDKPLSESLDQRLCITVPEAAKMLGITRRILKYKMDKLGITAPEENGL